MYIYGGGHHFETDKWPVCTQSVCQSARRKLKEWPGPLSSLGARPQSSYKSPLSSLGGHRACTIIKTSDLLTTGLPEVLQLELSWSPSTDYRGEGTSPRVTMEGWGKFGWV